MTIISEDGINILKIEESNEKLDGQLICEAKNAAGTVQCSSTILLKSNLI